MKVLGEDKSTTLQEPHDAVKVFQQLLAAEDPLSQAKEHYWVMHLDTRYRREMVELVSLGILNRVSSHPRETFRRAISEGSAYIIVAHNHPSGAVLPSDSDARSYRELDKIGRLTGIPLLDSVIITLKDYYSFAEHRDAPKKTTGKKQKKK